MKRPAVIVLVLVLTAARGVLAQEQKEEPTTRADVIEQAQSDKASALTPAHADKIEAYVSRLSSAFLGGQVHWHAFFHNAYSGGGFTVGAGYSEYVSPNNILDVRGSITFSGYKRIEAEFIAPGLFGRRATFDAIGGWREATQVSFYGFGMSSTQDARANYGFTQPYGTAMLEVRPARNSFLVRGGLELTQWNQGEGSGSARSRPTCTRRRPSGSTGERRPGTRGPAASTASPSTTSPTTTTRMGSSSSIMR